jgi:hypothetical protein
MRIAAIGALLLFTSCSTTDTASESPFQQPNSLMSGEITRRIEQIPYQHRDELLTNLLWLAQTGEQTIPALLTGLQHDNPKVRSSSAWVLGRLRDRRTIPSLQPLMRDSDQSVRTEAARTLVAMGDLKWSPTLIEGLDSDKKEVRYMCHESLKTATGHDFGYDHLSLDQSEMKVSVLRWRQWWSEYSGDVQFAQSYQQKHAINTQVAAPTGETKPMENAAPSSNTNPPVNQNPAPQNPVTTPTQGQAPAQTPATQSPTPQSPTTQSPATTPQNPPTTPATTDPKATTPATAPTTKPMEPVKAGIEPKTAEQPKTGTTPKPAAEPKSGANGTTSTTAPTTTPSTTTGTTPATTPATKPATTPAPAPPRGNGN